VVRLREGAWTCCYAYRAIYMETSLGRCKVHRGLYMGTSLIFLGLALCIPLVSSFSIFTIFAFYQFCAGHK